MPSIQFALLVLDASGSMSEHVRGMPPGTTKAWQVEEMICLPLAKDLNDPSVDKAEELKNCGLIARMQNSFRANATDLAIMRFDSSPEPYYDVKPIMDFELAAIGTKINPPQSDKDARYELDGKSFNLLSQKGGMTNIGSALGMAYDAAEQWIQQQPSGYNAFVTILLMSDMLQTEGSSRDALDIATKIRTNHMMNNRPQIVLATAAFGDNADLDIMKQLASPGIKHPDQFAIKVKGSIELRNFFLESATAHAEMIQP